MLSSLKAALSRCDPRSGQICKSFATLNIAVESDRIVLVHSHLRLEVMGSLKLPLSPSHCDFAAWTLMPIDRQQTVATTSS